MLHRRDLGVRAGAGSYRPASSSDVPDSPGRGRSLRDRPRWVIAVAGLMLGAIVVVAVVAPAMRHSVPITVSDDDSVADSKRNADESPIVKKIKRQPKKPLLDIAIVLVTFNRHEYLQQTLQSLMRIWPVDGGIGGVKFHLVISQDGTHPEVSQVIHKHMERDPSITHLRFEYDEQSWISENAGSPQEYMPDLSVYYKISAHFKSILRRAMIDSATSYHGLLFIEDDMEFAPDFLSYFAYSAPFLAENSETTLCVSAWNDHGQSHLVADPKKLLRADIFPGLGWMMTRAVALELYAKWPFGFWDDWLREPGQRLGRSCVFPEINRVKTFGKVGSSGGEFFDQYLAPIQLNAVAVDWKTEGMSHLKSAFNVSQYREDLNRAADASQLLTYDGLASLIRSDASDNTLGDVRVIYKDEVQFAVFAELVGCMPGFKSGFPRASFDGIVAVHLSSGRRLFITPKKHSVVVLAPPRRKPPRDDQADII
ncbi:alpha-1,3-mannosyl-glycoprotein 2-beta-N-acetylglucosaminyltransferase [Plasmodiophora brassicae]|uniref:alpha-1,3-mannosyl-glycoprotein 2-beta-N-acetylglucosaminyltransferase n=1 Tax=Plasmodiophora brassicae TaxID=37360 RepID=A0A0G4IGI8_PLABS|nr:hypothetical protein PBRA_000111 [Plasmodiophora brassicae]SPQ96675.1 unnamed protein product [Plasmodiophora brassicae]